MAEFRTPKGLVVGLVAKPEEAEKNEPKTETPPEGTEKKRNPRQKAEKRKEVGRNGTHDGC